MAVLVSGGAGYIGSHMVLALVDAGEDAVVLDNLSTGFAFAVHPKATLVQGDVADADLVRKIVQDHRIDAVVHFAARLNVRESVSDPLGYYLANTVKTRMFLQTLVEAGVPHLVFSSTAAVYGMLAGLDPVAEDAPLAPISPYGRSKLMSEWMLQDTAATFPFTYVALRYFNVAGADPQGRSGQLDKAGFHIIKVACETALGKRPGLDIYGTDYPTPDGTCVRDYIHVSDLADAHLCALRHLRAGGASGAYNCGYGRGYSVKEVVETVKARSGIDFPVGYGARREGDPAAIVAKADRIVAELGWTPKLDDLPTIVDHAFAWEQVLDARRGG